MEVPKILSPKTSAEELHNYPPDAKKSIQTLDTSSIQGYPPVHEIYSV